MSQGAICCLWQCCYKDQGDGVCEPSNTCQTNIDLPLLENN